MSKSFTELGKPDGFDLDAYTNVPRTLNTRTINIDHSFQCEDLRIDALHHFHSAWRNIRVCVIECGRALETYEVTFHEHGLHPNDQEAKHRKAVALMSFFYFCNTSFESFSFACFLVAVLKSQSGWKLTKNAIRRYYPQDVYKKLRTNYPDSTLEKALGDLLDSSQYGELKDLRNALSHQGLPSWIVRQTFHEPQKADEHETTEVEWKTMYGLTIDLDCSFLRANYVWMLSSLSRLTNATLEFINEQFPRVAVSESV